jgi:hypothetical protein
VFDQNAARLRLWDIRANRIVADVDLAAIVPGNRGLFSTPAFSADGHYIDFATEISGRFEIVRLRVPDLGLAATTSALPATAIQGDLAEVPHSDDVIGSGPQGLIWKWDMSTGRLVASGQSFDSSSLAGVTISSDGSTVAAWQVGGGTEALFDAATLRAIGQPILLGDVGWIGSTPKFAHDGKQLVGNGLFDTVEWDVDPSSWQTNACMAAGRNLTHEEWVQYLPNEPYRVSCSQWPAGT